MDWYEEHSDNSDPNEEDIESLAKQTNLTKSEIIDQLSEIKSERHLSFREMMRIRQKSTFNSSQETPRVKLPESHLRNWYEKYKNNPTPSKQQLRALAKKTGLTHSEVVEELHKMKLEKPKKKLSAVDRILLEGWLDTHKENPIPDSNAVQRLLRLTSLSRDEILSELSCLREKKGMVGNTSKYRVVSESTSLGSDRSPCTDKPSATTTLNSKDPSGSKALRVGLPDKSAQSTASTVLSENLTNYAIPFESSKKATKHFTCSKRTTYYAKDSEALTRTEQKTTDSETIYITVSLNTAYINPQPECM